MNDKELLKYLYFISENVVDLSNKSITEKIENTFGWNVFLNNINSLEEQSFIFEHEDRNTYSLAEKGLTSLTEIKNQLDFESRKQNIELENLKTSTEVNKFLLKTKWLPHFVAGISLMFSIYTYFDARQDSKKLQNKIEKLEKKVEINSKNNSKNINRFANSR